MKLTFNTPEQLFKIADELKQAFELNLNHCIAICKKHNVDFNVSGYGVIIEYTELSHDAIKEISQLHYVEDVYEKYGIEK